MRMRTLLPLFLDLAGRDVLLVGGGPVAAGKLRQLLAAKARVRVVAPDVRAEIESAGVDVIKRGFLPSDVEGVWLVIAAATRDINRQVADAAAKAHVFVNAVDDPANASAFMSGVVRRRDVIIGVSTGGDAPGLTALIREALDALLPRELSAWTELARRERHDWIRNKLPMSLRKPRLLEALNALYAPEDSSL